MIAFDIQGTTSLVYVSLQGADDKRGSRNAWKRARNIWLQFLSKYWFSLFYVLPQRKQITWTVILRYTACMSCA